MSPHKELYELGWMPVPCHVFFDQEKKKRFKKPLIDWRQYNRDPASYDFTIVDQRFDNAHPALGLGIVTGLQRDGTRVVVVDIDPPEDPNFPFTIPEELLEPSLNTMSTTTPSGGRHLYFKLPSTVKLTLKNKTNLFRKDKRTQTVIDLRAQGGFSVLGPTQLWEWSWYFDPHNNTHRRKNPLHPSPDHKPYTTLDYIAPKDLAPLPQFIIDAYKEHSNERLDYSLPSNEVKKQWENVVNKTTPDPSKGESLHGTLLSWSMRLVATYIKDVHTIDDAKALYGRFLQDVAPLVDKRNADPTKRRITEEELSKVFYTALDKIRNKRSATYRLAKHLIDPVLQSHVSEYEQALWDSLQVTKIINYSTHLYATNDASSKGFELTPQQLTRQQEWRTQHLIAFGPPILPKIKTKTFEDILSSISISNPPEHDTSTPLTMTRIILDGWLHDESAMASEPTLPIALSTARSTGRCVHEGTLYFSARFLQSALRNEGLGIVPLTKLTQIYTQLGLEPTDTPSVWKYVDTV